MPDLSRLTIVSDLIFVLLLLLILLVHLLLLLLLLLLPEQADHRLRLSAVHLLSVVVQLPLPKVPAHMYLAAPYWQTF